MTKYICNVIYEHLLIKSIKHVQFICISQDNGKDIMHTRVDVCVCGFTNNYNKNDNKN